jgi:pyruvate kinase
MVLSTVVEDVRGKDIICRVYTGRAGERKAQHPGSTYKLPFLSKKDRDILTWIGQGIDSSGFIRDHCNDVHDIALVEERVKQWIYAKIKARWRQ